MDLITKTDEIFLSFMRKIEKMDSVISEISKNYHPLLSGERYLTDKEVSKLLNTSRRTLQDYRKEGRIAYCMVGGKILYRESDIERLLAENYYPRIEF